MKDKILDNKNLEIKTINKTTSKNLSKEICLDWEKLNESNFKKMLRYYNDVSISPVEYLVTSLLTALSGAIGKNAYFKITNSLNIYLNVFAVIVGGSTLMRKTTAMNLVTQDLNRINTKKQKEYSENLDKYLKDAEYHKENKIKFDEPKPTREFLILPQNSTVESLADILKDSKRGLMLHSEFGGFLQQLNKGYSADAKQFLTTLYDVPLSYEFGRTTKENTYLERPYFAFLGASTIEWIKNYSNQSDLTSGFFARFIFSIRNIPDKDYIPLLKLKDITRQSPYYLNTREIFTWLCDIREEIKLDLTKEATEYHIEYDRQSYYELLSSENNEELSFKGRLLTYTLKFAGLITLCDKRTVVNLQDIEDAILLTDYYKQNVELLLNSELNRTELSNQEERIINLLEKNSTSLKRSEVMKRTRMSSKELDIVIRNLKEKDLLITKVERNNSNGRDTIFYQLLAS